MPPAKKRPKRLVKSFLMTGLECGRRLARLNRRAAGDTPRREQARPTVSLPSAEAAGLAGGQSVSGPDQSDCWREISTNPITGEARRQGTKWTLISLPRAKPARFCRRASNCSVTGPMIGRQPLTPLTPPRSCPHVAIFNDSLSALVPPARKSRARGTCLPPLDPVHYFYIPLRQQSLRALPFQRAAQQAGLGFRPESRPPDETWQCTHSA